MHDDFTQYLRATAILDYNAASLLRKREHVLTTVKGERAIVRALYAAVAALPLGYNTNDDISASRVLHDRYGQCNTKTTLLMALARGAGIPARLHAYHLKIAVQRGRAPQWILAFAPKHTVFFWPEFFVEKEWRSLQDLVFLGVKQWDGCPFDGARYQKQPLVQGWIAADLGTWNSPDAFFRKHRPTVHGWRTIGWRLFGRHALNRALRRKSP